ncbi:ubiquitin-specific protease ubp2 [Mortierella sp. GBA35]|nr:ubiquitin-specific protease ubp2 [Mortierella sp. GBA35]
MQILGSENTTPFYSTSDTPATPSDDVGPLVRALSLSPKGVTPHRWFVDLAFHEIGLAPHPHIFYLNPKETSDNNGGSVNVACSVCYKQYNIVATSGELGFCPGEIHHFHSRIKHDSVTVECCHCGTSVDAFMEQSTLPQSLIYKLQANRRPKAQNRNRNLPLFHETLSVFTRILKNATEAGSRSINTNSATFNEKVIMDDSSKEFFQRTGFTLVEHNLVPPEHTPETVRFLNRCLFQLQLVLLHEKPSAVNGLLTPAHTLLLKRLGAPKYASVEGEKHVNLSERASLLGEHHSPHGKLGCISNMTDELIIDAFQTQLSHDISTSHPLVDALSEIQKKRKSEALEFEIICRKSEGIVSTEELRSAYRHFEIPDNGEGISSEVLLGLIRGSLSADSKEHLRIVAKARNDPELHRLLELPEEHLVMDDPTLDLYYAANPVGLSNIGNTCYLNSLLQYMYTIKDIRETILNMEAYLENEQEEGWKEKVIDGRTLTRKDVTEAKEIVVELNKLFKLMQTAKARSVTPSSRLVELLLSTGGVGNAAGSSPRMADEFFEQQDVSETMSILMYRLSAAFKPIIPEPGAKPIDRFTKLFYSKAHKKVEKGGKRQIQEDFSTLLLNVKDDTSLEELMDDYFVADEPELSNTVAADGSKDADADAKATQMSDITVTELPSILQVHLLRTQFDMNAKTIYKSNATVTLPKRISMDQYLEANQEEYGARFKRMKLWKQERRDCRKMLDAVKQTETESLHQGSPPLNGQDVFNGTGIGANGPSEPQSDETTTPSADQLITTTTDQTTTPSTDQTTSSKTDVSPKPGPTTARIARISELNERIKNEMSDVNEAEYKIHAVFHHAGGANFGHYWVYIYDDKAEVPRWLKYSDEIVSEVGLAQEDEVFNGYQGSTACFCVYVRTSEPDAVQTVHRMIS